MGQPLTPADRHAHGLASEVGRMGEDGGGWGGQGGSVFCLTVTKSSTNGISH